MSKFSSIKAKPKAKPQPVTEETPVTPGAAETVDINDGFSVAEFIDFAASERETPEQPDPTATKTAPTENTTEPTPEETPEDKEATLELDDEMYAASGEVGAEVSDEVIPQLIKVMSGSDNADEFKATEKQKTGLARAWELYLRSIKQSMSPLSFLVIKHTVVYGGNFFIGTLNYVGRIKTYGFHWPWSDKWKRAKMRVVHTEPQPAPVAHAPMPPMQPPTPKAEPPTEPAPPTAAAEMKICMYWELKNGVGVETPKEFEKGKGYPKTSKNTEFIDRFSSQKAYMGYKNATRKK